MKQKFQGPNLAGHRAQYFSWEKKGSSRVSLSCDPQALEPKVRRAGPVFHPGQGADSSCAGGAPARPRRKIRSEAGPDRETGVDGDGERGRLDAACTQALDHGVLVRDGIAPVRRLQRGEIRVVDDRHERVMRLAVVFPVLVLQVDRDRLHPVPFRSGVVEAG